MGRIFCIGQSAYDITIPLTEAICENQKYRITEKAECGGGPAFNAAYLCALWGADVCLISRIGKDEYGKKLCRIAKEVGVHLDYLIPDHEIETPHSYIFSNQQNGSRTLFNFPGKLNHVEYTYPKEDVSVILSDGHEPDITIGAIRHYQNAVSIADAGTLRESTLKVAKEVDYLVCSEDFARQYTGRALDLSNRDLCLDIFREIETINRKHAVITMGEKGLLYRRNGKVCLLPAYPVKAVDTNGAGDIFHGAFAYGMSKNMDFYDILKLSSMSAAISVQTIGAQTSIPKFIQVNENFFKEEKNDDKRRDL